jgi:hypothetical protein
VVRRIDVRPEDVAQALCLSGLILGCWEIPVDEDGVLQVVACQAPGRDTEPRKNNAIEIWEMYNFT